MPPISPTEQNWLKTANYVPTQYAPGLTPPNANGMQLGASTVAPTPVSSAAVNASSGATADDIAYLNDQAAQLRALLARTDTGLNQGLVQNQDAYDTGLGTATQQKDAQVRTQNQGKLSAYDSINQNANSGYRSLAQIIGRAAGTGSSAFRDLLPDVIGKDTSSKRKAATDTYGQNLSNIDTSFNGVLASLLKQKRDNENNLRSGIETQRQGIQGQLASNAGQLAQAKGGGFGAVKAAQAPAQAAIENSRNLVESFFDRFRTPYTAPAVDPNLSQYQTDRTTINANNQPGVDNTNPYAAILRKKLQAA